MTTLKGTRTDKLPEKSGEYRFVRDEDDKSLSIWFRCPCGCNGVGRLPIQPHPSPSWAWDGNSDAPTLYPSVHNLSCGWHGWFRKGDWVSC